MRLGADQPFALETCYWSAQEFSRLTRASFARGSLFSILEHDYGIQLAYADEEADAAAAESTTANLLQVPRGHPLLRIRQVIYSTQGKATLYVIRSVSLRPIQPVSPKVSLEFIAWSRSLLSAW